MTVETTAMPDTAEDILQRVEALAETFRRRLPATEDARTVSAESIRELVEAGVARMLVPAEHGGLDLRIRDAVDTVEAAAHGDASTGWVSWLMIHGGHVVGMFPAEAQEAVWTDGPNVVLAGSHIGMTVKPAADGYRISGKGAFTSGCINADWVYVGGMQPVESGPPQVRYFLLHKDQYTIADTWHTVGMRGTGSNTVVVDDVFVPEGFTLLHDDAREGTGPGTALNANPALRLPWVATGALGFIATMLGAARAAFDDVVGSLAKKKTPAGVPVADSQALQIDVGLIAVQLDAARTLLRSVADRADAGGEFTLCERATLTATGSYVADLAVRSVDKLLELSGTSGFGENAVVQQCWRDIHFAASHISLNKRETWGRNGRKALGIEESTLAMFF